MTCSILSIMKLLNYQLGSRRIVISMLFLLTVAICYLLTSCLMPMKHSTEFCMVLTTCPNQQEADTHAKAIIEKRLGACVQSNPIHSHYMWEGKFQSDPEVLLRIKTTCDNFDALEQYLKAAHSYEVPQIIQVPINNGLPEYFDWVRENTMISGQ